MAKASKKDMIMDVAEHLFGQRGFHAVSVRDITSAAGVRLAAVNYYFGTKEKLYIKLVRRKGRILATDRLERLAKIDFDSLDERQAIAQICHASLDPLLERVINKEPGWRDYYSILATLAESDLIRGQRVRENVGYRNAMLVFVERLQSVALDGSEHKAHNAFQFIISMGLVVFANNGRSDTLSDGEYRSDDFENIYPGAMDFIVAGATAMLLEE